MACSNTEYADTDGSNLTDPVQGHTAPLLNGINGHKWCIHAGCPVGSTVTQEMGSPQFRNGDSDNHESEDAFGVCLNNGGPS
jgi:hypothetical protein